MTFAALIVVYFGILLLLTRPVGTYMARLFSNERVFLTPVMAPVERVVYRLTAVDAKREQGWKSYTVAMLLFSAFGVLLTFLIQRVQGDLPLNPEGLPGVGSESSFNTAASFVSNTNWQGYYPEATMSYLTQMIGLAVHNFLSAATGIAIAVAVIRGFARRSAKEIGNFWVDMTRTVLYILLPISVVAAFVFIAAGVPQTFGAYREVVSVAGDTLRVPLGPVASQEAIKMLGTNGGGFFNANSAHPFENPNGFTNLIQMLLIFVIPAGLTYTFGRMVGNTKQGWAIFTAMSLIFFIGVAATTIAEQSGNPNLTTAGASQATEIAGETAPGGNMESKEVRFGIKDTALFAVITTAASCGAVNGMHDSFTALGGMIPLANIALGEIVFGGVGSGLYGMLIYAVITVFIAGLMVGRTPEYLGKKIEPFDVKMAMLALLVIPLLILGFTAIAISSDNVLTSRWNPAAHGFTEFLYAFSSAAGNNGSAFAGISANVPFFNIALGFTMLAGRFLIIVPALALAGNLARKGRTQETAGTFPTTGGLWVGLLIGVILIVGALTYFPAYALGPVIEHFQMRDGNLFGL